MYFVQNCFCEISSADSGIHVVVPPGHRGGKLLGELVDMIDGLMEEWFPGLLDVRVTGEPVMEVIVHCIQCQGQ